MDTLLSSSYSFLPSLQCVLQRILKHSKLTEARVYHNGKIKAHGETILPLLSGLMLRSGPLSKEDLPRDPAVLHALATSVYSS